MILDFDFVPTVCDNERADGLRPEPKGQAIRPIKEICSWISPAVGRSRLGCLMRSLVSSNRMRRGVHIALSLIAVFLLLKPFDCFSGSKFTKEAADCCRRGKCRPSTGDDCCKGTLPDGKNLVAASKAHRSHALMALPIVGAVVIAEPAVAPATFQQTSAPPGSPPGSRTNLPLLI